MKLKLLLAACSFLLFKLCAGQVPPMTIDSIAPNIYLYTTFNTFQGKRYSANALLVRTSAGCILIDVPWQRSQYKTIMDTVKTMFHSKIIAVYATHFHEDRAGDLSYFNKRHIPTYATSATNKLLKKEHKSISSHTTQPGRTYTYGDVSFIVDFMGAGHTPDNVIVWFPKQQLLDGGCLIKSISAVDLGNLSDANVAAWKTTIQKTIQKYGKAKIVIPGHDGWQQPGHLAHTGELIEKYLKNNQQP